MTPITPTMNSRYAMFGSATTSPPRRLRPARHPRHRGAEGLVLHRLLPALELLLARAAGHLLVVGLGPRPACPRRHILRLPVVLAHAPPARGRATRPAKLDPPRRRACALDRRRAVEPAARRAGGSLAPPTPTFAAPTQRAIAA